MENLKKYIPKQLLQYDEKWTKNTQKLVLVQKNRKIYSAPKQMQFWRNQKYTYIFFEGFTSILTALTANDRNRRIQVYQASDG